MSETCPRCAQGVSGPFRDAIGRPWHKDCAAKALSLRADYEQLFGAQEEAMAKPKDEELAVMNRVLKALNTLEDHAAQVRVAEYAYNRVRTQPPLPGTPAPVPLAE